MYGGQVRLLHILKENKDKKYRRVAGAAAPLLSGRPSANIKNIKMRAESDPAGLISDLGIEVKEFDNAIEFMHNAFVQMISDATGNDKARLMQDLFSEPEIV